VKYKKYTDNKNEVICIARQLHSTEWHVFHSELVQLWSPTFRTNSTSTYCIHCLSEKTS